MSEPLRKAIVTDPNKEIVSRAKNLEIPKSHMVGKYFPEPLLPQNILMFRQTSRAVLINGGYKHQHHRYVLVTAVQSGGEIGIDKRIFPIHEGECILIHPLQVHWFSDLVKPTILWLFTSFEHDNDTRLKALLNKGGIFDPVNKLDSLRKLLRAWQTPEERDTVRLQLGIWLDNLVHQADKKYQPRHSKKLLAKEDAWIAEINRLIFEKREQALSLPEIARHFGISPSSFSKKFHETTGKSPGWYIRQLKLEYACELLQDTKTRVSEIAERCGYDSIFSFSRAFHKTFLTSPSSYRKTWSPKPPKKQF